jgi:hypothetical protein
VTANLPGSGVPTGSVTFTDGTTKLGTVTLSGGTASYSTAKLTTSAHSITATYNGTGSFVSSSSILTQTVNPDNSTTGVVTSLNPSVFGQSVTLTAAVSANTPGSGTPTGTVTFYFGSTSIGTGTLGGAKATIKTAALPAGSDTITAVYGGDSNFVTSTSVGLIQVVNFKASSASLAQNVNNASSVVLGTGINAVLGTGVDTDAVDQVLGTLPVADSVGSPLDDLARANVSVNSRRLPA